MVLNAEKQFSLSVADHGTQIKIPAGLIIAAKAAVRKGVTVRSDSDWLLK